MLKVKEMQPSPEAYLYPPLPLLMAIHTGTLLVAALGYLERQDPSVAMDGFIFSMHLELCPMVSEKALSWGGFWSGKKPPQCLSRVAFLQGCWEQL